MFKKTILSAILMSFSFSACAVNVNTAGPQEIADSLKGIGIKKATRIVQYREDNGKFKDTSDLVKVKGIGEKTIEKNKNNLEF